MAHIIANKPEPAEATYDILSLTQDEINLLAALIGRTTGGDKFYPLYQMLSRSATKLPNLNLIKTTKPGEYFAIRVGN